MSGTPFPLPCPGDRIELLRMDNDPAPLPPGSQGLVLEVHADVRQIFVIWDCGRTLILLTDDDYRILDADD